MSDQPNAVEDVRHLFQNIFAGEDSEGKSKTKPIFVSFDIAHGSKKGFSAIGVSVLDTRCFTGSTLHEFKNHGHSLFWTHTYNFQYGSPGVKRTQKRALFDGDAQKVSARDRTRLLEHIFFYPMDEDVTPCCQSQSFRPFRASGAPRSPSRVGDGRSIIVVGHAINSDLRSLSRAGFSIAQVAPILAVIDTQKVARELYWKDDRSKNVSLKDLCTLMGFHPTKLHSCGNDAAYTLIALLSLASRIVGKEQEGAAARDTLEELVQITLGLARTAKQKFKAMRRDEQDVKDWMEYLDGKNV
ncbi:hypothetical protein B0J11DRAFT_576669 [Dendryphion nanum]|uniref:Gfd2/YDR514C-like C-terminal domain-containing protein n=1 Tax=Dendryphion nanum TaxID=256645 RepID=A0A9P9ED30_9PLEO|nr:hypothetical protein B0J11DRAFT_576669 [Dendryphion nanum]